MPKKAKKAEILSFSGDPIREARMAAGLTQEESAEAAGITPESLSRLENGRWPSFSLLSRVADVLVGPEGRSRLLGRCIYRTDKNWAGLAGVESWEAARQAVARRLDQGDFSSKTEILARAVVQLARNASERARGFMLIGNLWKDRGELDLAYESYSKALQLVDETTDRDLWELIYVNLVNAQADSGRWPEVMLPAESLAASGGRPIIRGYARMALGKAFGLKGDHDRSQQEFAAARAEFKQLDEPNHLGWAEMWLVRARFLGGRMEQMQAVAKLRAIHRDFPLDPEIRAWCQTWIYEMCGDEGARVEARRIAKEHRMVVIERRLAGLAMRGGATRTATKAAIRAVCRAMPFILGPSLVVALWTVAAVAKSANG